jgi:hypothetical protein
MPLPAGDPGIDPGMRPFQHLVGKTRIVDCPGEFHRPTIAAQLPIAARRRSAGFSCASERPRPSIRERRFSVMAARAAGVWWRTAAASAAIGQPSAALSRWLRDR